MTMQVQCTTDDLALLIDNAKKHGSAMLIFGNEEGQRMCLLATPSHNGKAPRPRAPRTQAAGATAEPAPKGETS
jgi:hypothetical protein